ncbi:hypothetical protein LTR84_004503 [Exophiala bonariae]|uniref:Enoyl reductase (ER) domain-containing protein n=1 Tax=Exophiala bonariae TaxID=1690606 RepID=A0AAV9N557_9EURO|nr:hypothetical protein LTR84_004503 [Exophiala bonariae]
MTTHIAGHEGVGNVVDVGEGVSPLLLANYVGVSWLHQSCGKCDTCSVDYTYCPNQLNTGRNVPGTFQRKYLSPAETVHRPSIPSSKPSTIEYCLADSDFITAIPAGLPAEIAAPLLCGGISTYGAILRANLSPRSFVVIPGAGGGLGHLGVQIASNLGHRVIAIDSALKEELCLAQGAEHFFSLSSAELVDQILSVTSGGAHAVICVAGAPAAYDMAISMLRNCGKLVCVGIPPSSYRLAVSPFEMLVKGIHIIGSTVGDRAQIRELMKMAVDGKVKPKVTVFGFEDLPSILDSLNNSKVEGRSVVRF